MMTMRGAEPRECTSPSAGDSGLETAHCGDRYRDLKPLIQEMLSGVRRHRETTLLAGFDARGLVSAALDGVAAWIPQRALAALPDLESVETACYSVVETAVRSDEDGEDGDDRASRDGSRETADRGPALALNPLVPRTPDAIPPRVADWLAIWLEEFSIAMNELHPRAIEVVMLRVEACDERRIAEKLELPLRLVLRVLHDILGSCARRGKPASTTG